MKSFKQFLNKRVLTVSALAKKHGVDTDYIERQLKKGIKVEHEHTTKLKVARQIALAHLGEDPDYYKKLKKIEKKTIKEDYKLSDKVIHTVYDLRRQGYGSYNIADKIRDEHNLGTYDPKILDRAAEEAKSKFPDLYHPKNKRTASSLVKRKLKPEDIEKIKKERESNGLSFGQISQKYRVSPTTISTEYYKAKGIKPKPLKNNPDTVRTVIGLIHKGHSASSVGDFLGVTKNKVIGISNRTDQKTKDDIIKGLEDNPPKEYLEHKDKPVVKKLEGKAGWKNRIKEEGDCQMTQTLTESRMKKILGMFSRKSSKADRIEHARHAYKIINMADERLTKQLEGAHPDVQKILEYLKGHHKDALKMLNKMGAGEDPMTAKKSKEQERM